MSDLFKKLIPSIAFTKNYTLTLLLEVCSKGLPYLFLPFFLRYMSKADFAIYSFITFIIIALSSLLFNSTETVFSALYYKYEKEHKLNFNLFVMVVLTHLSFAIFIFGGWLDKFLLKWLNYLPTNLFIFKLVLVLASFANGYTTLFSKYFAFIDRFRYFQFWNVLRIFFVNIFLVLLFLVGFIQLDFISRFYVETILFSIFFLLLFVKWIQGQRISFSTPILKESFWISLPMLISSICFFLNTLADKYIIHEKFSLDKLASYNLAFILILPMGLLFTTFFEVIWTPRFFRRKDTQVNYRLTVAFLPKYLKSLLMIFPFYFLFVFLVIWLSGNMFSYIEVLWLIGILYVIKMFSFSSQFFNNFFIYHRKTYLSAAINVFITVCMLTANLYFIPKYSIGAAVTILFLSELLKLLTFYFIISAKFART